MEIYRTEQEQIDQLKSLWRQYGKPIIVGVILALVMSYGWNYWQSQQDAYRIQASVIYSQLLNNAEHDDTLGVESQAKQLMSKFKKTPYAILAALQLAKQAVVTNNLDEAQAKLQWASAHAKDPALKQLAILRMARVYIAQNKPTQALDILAKENIDIYASYAEEVRGDALLTMHKPEQAREAYAKALKLAPDVENIRALLKMKYDAIPK